MDEELSHLLSEWELDEDIKNRLTDAKILKVRTLKLLNENDVVKLIPDLGPRLEFRERLREMKLHDVTDMNGNPIPVITVPAAIDQPQVSLPDVIMVDDGDADVSVLEVELNLQPNGQPLAKVMDAVNSGTARDKQRVIATPNATARKRPCTCSASKEWTGPSDINYDLEKLVQSTLPGKILLSEYKTRQDLVDTMRNKLGDLIIADFLKYDVNRKLEFQDEKDMTGHICSLFASEKKEMWQSSSAHARQKASCRGILLTRYYHTRRVMRKAGLISASKSDAGLTDDVDDESDSENEDTEEQRAENEDKDLFLRNNKTPYQKIHEYWQATAKWRLKKHFNSKDTVDVYMSRYPILAEPSCHLLLEVDFDIYFPQSVMKLYLEWIRLAEFVKGKVTKKQLEKIDFCFKEDGKRAEILRSLPYLFAPVTAAKKGKNSNWRPSRLECADGIILHVEDSRDIQLKVNQRRDKFKEFSLPMGPIAVMVGSDADNITASYVIINKVQCATDDPMKALNIAFKMTHSVDAQYNKDVEREMQFLQLAVYQIPRKNSQKKPDQKVLDLVEKYKKFKESAST